MRLFRGTKTPTTASTDMSDSDTPAAAGVDTLGVKLVAAATVAPAVETKPMISAVLLEEKAMKEPGTGAVEPQGKDLADSEQEDDAKVNEAKEKLMLAIRAFRRVARREFTIGGETGSTYLTTNNRLVHAIDTNLDMLDDEDQQTLRKMIDNARTEMVTKLMRDEECRKKCKQGYRYYNAQTGCMKVKTNKSLPWGFVYQPC